MIAFDLKRFQVLELNDIGTVQRALDAQEKILIDAEMAKGGYLHTGNTCEFCGVEFEFRSPRRFDDCGKCVPCYNKTHEEPSGMPGYRETKRLFGPVGLLDRESDD